jgi:molybdopterin/thiamine biosynthesis adenylyltransferase
MNLDAVYSRPQKTADQLANMALDRHRFLTKKVLLAGESDVLKTANGANCLLDSLGLLVRICRNITVAIPPDCSELLAKSRAYSDRIAFGNNVEYRTEPLDLLAYDAILSVGSAVRPELPWTTISSNGWLARVSSGDLRLPADCALENPIGALAAASLGVGEVFKRLIKVKPERGDLLNGIVFSLRSYRTGDSDAGPALPANLELDVLLVGGGAIGNGVAHLLSQLPCHGRIDIVDRQEYGEENLGTCILIGADQLGQPKAEVLASMLNTPRLDATGFPMAFERYLNERSVIPEVVVNGLDNISARHEVQRELWPDVIFDGAIGDFTCQASRHPWPDDIACLICMFREPVGKAADVLQSEATGLSLDRVCDPDGTIAQSDVDHAPAERQKFLRARLGRRICSVIQEGIALQVSEDQQAKGFEPSVPFTACFSACMVVAEVVAHLMNWPSVLEPRFQFDFLVGPSHGQELPQGRRPDCICARKKNIERVRVMRSARRRPFPGESSTGEKPAA